MQALYGFRVFQVATDPPARGKFGWHFITRRGNEPIYGPFSTRKEAFAEALRAVTARSK